MFVALVAIAGCTQSASNVGGNFTSAQSMVSPGRTHAYRASARERECLARAMFFESNRSSRDGLVAVGSVVMNRKDTGKWGDDICEVVGAKRQFAPGVLSRPMKSEALPDVMAAADAVLKGERHPKVHEDVMFFHTAGLKFPYKNMHYTTVAGGNAFYEKRSRKQDRLPRPENDVMPGVETVMVAQAEQPPAALPQAAPVAVAGRPTPEQEVQVAFAGDTPSQSGRETAIVRQAAFVEEDALPVHPAVAQLPDTMAITPTSVAAVLGAADAGTIDAPSSERFGGDTVQPAYSNPGSGNDGWSDGSGILGKLVVRSN
ncbi:cell wall hydrolase [Arvimicrobium flavum]|uniref:cell wall hydrolase n=1 Tax=Arvimicrobium flavum TaxID=3393320 RepID=UPI00237AE501|nr:cell wall hydrolase [Mesorhizobium shangrilense]